MATASAETDNGQKNIVSASFVQLEDMRNHCKTHRNIMELDAKYLETVSLLESESTVKQKISKRNQISFKNDI